MTTTAQELITKAADHIEEVGLNKGTYFKGGGINGWGMGGKSLSELADVPCCTYGALYYVAEGAAHLVNDAARVIEDHLETSIPDWNDKPSQRKSRVVAALRKAAGVTA